MANYTGEKILSVDDLKRLRDQYNNLDDYGDRSFMNELFHGLDDIINRLDPNKALKSDANSGACKCDQGIITEKDCHCYEDGKCTA